MKKLLVMASVLAAVLLAAILVLRPGKANADHEVLCHKYEHGDCNQDYKDHCGNGWISGGCPTSSPTSTPTNTPTPTPTRTPTPTPTPTRTPTPTPTHTPNSCEPATHSCSHDHDCCSGDCHNWHCRASATATPTLTPTPTATTVTTATPTPTSTVDVSPSPDPTATPTNAPFVPPTCTGDQHLDASGRNCVSFGVPGVEQPTGNANGQVLGASTTAGQVLGASTMAGTGVAEETLFNAIFALGSALTAFGVRKIRTSRVK